MKKMSKLWSVLLAIVMILALSACGDKENSDGEEKHIIKSDPYQYDVMDTIGLNEPFSYGGITVEYSDYRFGEGEYFNPIHYTVKIRNDSEEPLQASDTLHMNYSMTSLYINKELIVDCDIFDGPHKVPADDYISADGVLMNEIEFANHGGAADNGIIYLHKGEATINPYQAYENDPNNGHSATDKYSLEFAPKIWGGKSVVVELN